MKFLFYLLQKLSTFADHLARPGRFFQWLFFETLQRTDSATAGRRRETPLWLFLLAPFRSMGDLWERATRTAPQKFDSQRLQKELDKKVQLAEKKSRARRFWNLVLAPIVLPIGFLWALFSTRSRKLIWYSLPLITIVGVLAYTVYQVRYVDRSSIAARYQSAMADAVSAGDFQAAQLFQAKLEQLGVQTNQGEYRTALAEAEAGQFESAVIRMKKIAPLDRIGFPGAHYWLATHLIDGKIGQQSEQDLLDASQHLNYLETAVRSQPSIEYLRALIALRQNEVDLAVPHLQKSADSILPAAGLLMNYYLKTGQESEAKSLATQFLVLLEQKENAGTLSEQESRWKITSSGLLKDQASAVAAVQQWYKNHPDSREARLQQAMVYVREFDQIAKQHAGDKDSTDAEKAAQLLSQASLILPSEEYRLISKRTAGLLRGTDSWSQSVVQQLIQQPENSGRLWEQLGTSQMGKDWDLCVKLLEQATQADPQWHRAWNNLAYILHQQFPNRRQKALEMANRAVELAPTNADYRETRGTIHFALEQWEAAVADLEIAANGFSEAKEIHKNLAIAYEKLGNQRMMKLHQLEAK